jgi:hypothetical protein
MTTAGVCLCGGFTAETDRSGRAAHRACVDGVLAAVAAESQPYEDYRGVAAWVAAHPPTPTMAAESVGGGSW